MQQLRATILALAVSLGFFLLSLHAIRRQRLRERQALLWMGVCLMMVLLSATLPLHVLDRVSHFVGIAYPPDLILLVAVLFLVALVFQQSLALARLTAKQTVLVQEIGLLAAESDAGSPIDSGSAPRVDVPTGDATSPLQDR